jgi:beta-glucosidase
LVLLQTFDPAVTKEFGRVASIEYRALGLTTALSPQIDIATDPRWNRVAGTFGEDPQLSSDMARAYVDGFQSSSAEKEIKDGWGYESVNAMVKHWPGGGSGRPDATRTMDLENMLCTRVMGSMHTWSVYGRRFQAGRKNINGISCDAYYTISYNQDSKNKENVGNAYNSYLINDLMREKYQYDGVACTDWGVTGDETALEYLSRQTMGS